MSKLCVVNEIHKAARRNFQRRSVILKGIDDLWQADLIDIKNYQKINKGFKFILVIIDAFSKYAWLLPLKTKTKTEVTVAFEKILKTGRNPKNLQTDMGTEFYNDIFQKLMKKYQINHYSTYSTKKASIVERLIRTIKSKLFKHFSLVGNYKWNGTPLIDIVNSYNNTMHRTTKYKPSEINKINEPVVANNIKKAQFSTPSKKNKFCVGDIVRISKYKGDFQKGYTPNWSTELFTVLNVNKTTPTTYNIEDQHHRPIKGCFYEHELQKTKCANIYLVEKVIKKRGRKLLVKWLGLSETENSWIDQSAVVKN